MATIDVGARPAGTRALDHEVPLIPFIDFLLCLVAFLLITAVWSQSARIEANARVPGPPPTTTVPSDSPRTLHIELRSERAFRLSWKEGSTVVETFDVPRRATPGGDGVVRYPELSARASLEWRRHGAHRGETDTRRDPAVLHVNDTERFAEVIAVIDALHSVRREVRRGGTHATLPAFDVAFAAN